jgi:hypothetical protein
MTQQAFSPPRAAFVEYSQKNIDTHGVMRAMMEHDDWLAPAVFTSPDNLTTFLDTISGKPGQFRTISAGGEKLLRIVASFGMDAICFNPHGPGARFECPAEIAELALSAG